MAAGQLGVLLHHIHRLAGDGRPGQPTDRQLLEEFAAGRDEAAFAELVARHGRMVLRVCRRVLRHEQDAEDAFQATFLVLARNVGSIRKREAVAGWLYGVAYRTAMKARRSAARRRDHEGRAGASAPRVAAEPTWCDVQAALDEEVERLPGLFRAAFALCVLEGKGTHEAAAALGCKPGTVSSRVTRARRLLRDRLARRGIALSAVLAVADGRGRAAVPAALAKGAVRYGLLVAAGDAAAGTIPPHLAALAEGVTGAMVTSQLKVATAVLLAVGLAAAGILARQAPAAREQPVGRQQSEAPGQKPEPAAAKPPAANEEGDRAEVSGRVLDPDGRPVAGAKVVFHQRRPYRELPDFFPEPATGTTDADGRFRFSGAVHRNAPVRDRQPMLTLTAHVPGYGPAATVEANSPDELKDRTLRLVKDDVPIRGRILSLEGKPIPGVMVQPVSVVANAVNDLGRLLKAIETNTWADLPDEQRTNIVFAAAAAGLTQTATTDAEGRFSLSGFGRERIVVLRLDGPTIETCLLNVMTRTGPTVRATRPTARGGLMPPGPPPSAAYVYAHGAAFDFVPGPGMVVEGTVRDQDSGKPLAGVAVRQGIDFDFGWAEGELTTTTDAGGNYRLAGVSRSSPRGYYHAIEFDPAAGQPYMTAALPPPAPETGKPARLDIPLKRGIVVKGRVTDRATGRPVQAVVEYFAFADNPNLRGVKSFRGSQVVSSRKDGSFTLAALPGRGIVAAKTDDMRRGAYLCGRGADAIPGLNARQGFFETSPYLCFPGQFDTLAGIEPDAKAEAVACNLRLDPGKPVKGTIFDPDGKPLAGVSIRGPFWAGIHIRELPSAAFTLAAVNPDKPEAYFFEHRQKHLAAAVILKGDEPEGFTLKLKPTATVTGRAVTEDGEPVRNAEIHGRLDAGQLNMAQSWNGFFWSRTDADGRFRIEGLLAGVKVSADNHVSKLFTNLTLEPGEVRDLGEVKVKNIPD